MKRNIPLAAYTTFRIGGKVKFFVEVSTKEELQSALDFAESHKLPTFILGGGSNILVSDNGYEGIVIKPINNTVKIDDMEESVEITVGAGMIWDDLVKQTIDQNLQGIECLSGIPGTVGAAPVQNIGAYGQELKDALVRLEAFDTKKSSFITLSKQECEFGYRDSIFKKDENKGRFIIWQVTFKLQKNLGPAIVYESLKNYLKDNMLDNPSLEVVRNAVIELRKKNHIDPKKAGNAGSFFKNPIITSERFENLKKNFPEIPSFPADKGQVKLFAGWLIEHAGWKGKKHKNVAVSPKHALILINPEHKAKAAEVEELATHIQNDVNEKFGVILEREVQTI